MQVDQVACEIHWTLQSSLQSLLAAVADRSLSTSGINQSINHLSGFTLYIVCVWTLYIIIIPKLLTLSLLGSYI